MKQTFLDFEQPIAELQAKIDELRYVHEDSAVGHFRGALSPDMIAGQLSADFPISSENELVGLTSMPGLDEKSGRNDLTG